MTGTGGRASTLMVTLGIFLKLLGFFVVMFTYAEFEPIKVKQAEYSLQQRFNVTLPLPDLKSGEESLNLFPVQNLGRAFHVLEEELKTELDIFSTRVAARENELALVFSANQILDLNGKPARSPNFAPVLSRILRKNTPQNFVLQLDIVAQGSDTASLMRETGVFVQKMIVAGYPQKEMIIGYEHGTKKPTVKLIIRAVPR